MNKTTELILKALRKFYDKAFTAAYIPKLGDFMSADESGDLLFNLLSSDKPCMVARYGSTELNAIVNYLGVTSAHHSWLGYIQRREPQWWWNEKSIAQMETHSGFFPPTLANIERFCRLMVEDSQYCDILACWQYNERFMEPYFPENIQKIHLLCLEPYFSERPWSRALANKKVLVIHPFSEQIESQYNSVREELFTDKKVLPAFKSLQTIKAVQSLGGESNGFKDWFEALNFMKAEIDKCDYDICLIGCGAYGFPLAAHVKRAGKKAVHMGGALQLLFGIKGNRWEEPTYGSSWGVPYGFYPSLMNEHWVKPSNANRPSIAQNVEGACYW